MSVICFGDSNTYGYDPRSFLGDRYPKGSRWIDILSAKTRWPIKNEGTNGQEIPRSTVKLPMDTELFIVMLGTNDLLLGRSVFETAENMEQFLQSLSIPFDKILVITPPPMVRGAWVDCDDLVSRSRALAQAYGEVASSLGARFADAGDWGVSMCFDGVHFTEDGHKRFAEGLFQYLQKENLLCLKLV